MRAHENKTDNESETHIPTQQEVDQQITNYIGSFTRQLPDLTWLFLDMSSAHRSSFFTGPEPVLVVARPVLHPTVTELGS